MAAGEVPRSTWMNSGRSFGRHSTSTSASTCGPFHPRASRPADLVVDEVQRHLHVDLLTANDTLEIDVLDLRLVGMPLVSRSTTS